jgi:branched-chain amino acid transport system ATP-binding protein
VNRIAKLGLGTVPEGRRLFPKLTVKENLRLGFQLITETISFADALEPIAMRFPRVSERLDQQAGTLSGGEQAMVALARALISKPRYLIMDEPSLGLAPNLVEEYFNLVAALRGGEQAILLIEQNVAKSLVIADRAYVLKKGQLAFSGTAAELQASGEATGVYLGKL